MGRLQCDDLILSALGVETWGKYQVLPTFTELKVRKESQLTIPVVVYCWLQTLLE